MENVKLSNQEIQEYLDLFLEVKEFVKSFVESKFEIAKEYNLSPVAYTYYVLEMLKHIDVEDEESYDLFIAPWSDNV